MAEVSPLLTGTVSAAQLAALLGLSTRRVRELAEAGTIPRSGGRYRLPDAVQRYVEHLREVAAGRATVSGGRDLVAERARLAAAQADRQELELSARRGELVNAAEIERFYVGMVKAAVNRLRGVPSKAKGRAPHLDVNTIEILEDEIDTALREIAEGDGEESADE